MSWSKFWKFCFFFCFFFCFELQIKFTFLGSLLTHSSLQRPRSFWSAPGIATSGRTRFPEHAQSFRFVFSVNQLCQSWRKVRESRTSGVGPAQRSRFLVLTKRSATSEKENAINIFFFSNFESDLSQKSKNDVYLEAVTYYVWLLSLCYPALRTSKEKMLDVLFANFYQVLP